MKREETSRERAWQRRGSQRPLGMIRGTCRVWRRKKEREQTEWREKKTEIDGREEKMIREKGKKVKPKREEEIWRVRKREEREKRGEKVRKKEESEGGRGKDRTTNSSTAQDRIINRTHDR